MRTKLTMWNIVILQCTLLLLMICLHVGGETLDKLCNKDRQLTVKYWDHGPYITRTSRDSVTGIFPSFLDDMVGHCCKGAQVKYQQTNGPADFYKTIKEMKLTKYV